MSGVLIVTTKNSRYVISDGEIAAETGMTVLDGIPGARFVTDLGNGLPDVTRVAIADVRVPEVGQALQATVGGKPFATSRVVGIERY